MKPPFSIASSSTRIITEDSIGIVIDPKTDADVLVRADRAILKEALDLYNRAMFIPSYASPGEESPTQKRIAFLDHAVALCKKIQNNKLLKASEINKVLYLCQLQLVEEKFTLMTDKNTLHLFDPEKVTNLINSCNELIKLGYLPATELLTKIENYTPPAKKEPAAFLTHAEPVGESAFFLPPKACSSMQSEQKNDGRSVDFFTAISTVKIKCPTVQERHGSQRQLFQTSTAKIPQPTAVKESLFGKTLAAQTRKEEIEKLLVGREEQISKLCHSITGFNR